MTIRKDGILREIADEKYPQWKGKGWKKVFDKPAKAAKKADA